MTCQNKIIFRSATPHWSPWVTLRPIWDKNPPLEKHLQLSYACESLCWSSPDCWLSLSFSGVPKENQKQKTPQKGYLQARPIDAEQKQQTSEWRLAEVLLRSFGQGHWTLIGHLHRQQVQVYPPPLPVSYAVWVSMHQHSVASGTDTFARGNYQTPLAELLHDLCDRR